MGIFEDFSVVTFQADGGTEIPISVLRLSEETEWRLIPRPRPFRKGAKLDNTSRNHTVWTMDSMWQEGLDEPGIPASGYYPAMLNALRAAFDTEKTGTLSLPTVGKKRVQCKTYKRVEESGERDFAAVSLTWWEDSEDDVTAASFTATSPVVAAPLIYSDASDAMAAIGLVSTDVSSLGSLVDALTSALELVDSIADIIDNAETLVATVASIETVWTNQTLDVGASVGRILSDPESWYPARLLRRLAGQAAVAALNASANQQQETTVVRVPQVASIFDVAAQFPGQDVGTLLRLNANLGDPYAIPADTPITIEVV